MTGPLSLYDQILGQENAGANGKLTRAGLKAGQITPDAQAEAITLGQKAGVPTAVAERDPKGVRSSIARRDTTYQRLLAEAPKLSSWLENPENAAVASDDLEHLALIAAHLDDASGAKRGFWRSLGTGLGGGLILAETGIGHALEAVGELLDNPAARAKGLLAGEYARKVGGVLKGDAKANSAFYTPRVSSIADVKGAGDLRDYLAFQVGQAAGTMGSVIAGTLAGGPAGGLAAGGTLAFGDIRDELEDAGVEAGPMKNAVALALAIPVAMLDRITPGEIAAKLMAKGASQALVSEAAQHGLTRTVAAAFVKTAVAEGSTEAAQEIIQALGVQAVAPEGAPEQNLLMRVVDAFIGGAVGGGVIGGVAGGAADHARARKAERQQQFFTALGEGVKDSKTFQRLPEKMQDVVATLTKDGPLETAFIPIEPFITYWQSQKEDPAQIAIELGIGEQFAEAVKSGADLAVPMATYATKLAPTPHNTFFANEIKTNPLAMNFREAQEFGAKMDAEEKVRAEAEGPARERAQQVAANIAQQLETAGFDPATAASYAQVYEGVFRSLGERTGTDPLELFTKYGLTIQRTAAPAEGAPPQVNNNATMLAVLRDQAAQFETQLKAATTPEQANAVMSQLGTVQQQITALERQVSSLGQRMPLQEEVKAFAGETQESLGLEEFDITIDRRGATPSLYLDSIVVPKATRKQGIGTKALERLVRFADERGLMVALSLGDKNNDTGTTSRERLRKFYSRFGFVSNRGRNKDFSLGLSTSMYRQPARGRQTFFQQALNAKATPEFYSQLERMVEAAKITSAPADQWAAWLKGLGNKGVKSDELFWSGIFEWLDLQKAEGNKVTKEQVVTYVAENGVKVKDRMLDGEAQVEFNMTEWQEDEPGDDWFEDDARAGFLEEVKASIAERNDVDVSEVTDKQALPEAIERAKQSWYDDPDRPSFRRATVTYNGIGYDYTINLGHGEVDIWRNDGEGESVFQGSWRGMDDAQIEAKIRRDLEEQLGVDLENTGPQFDNTEYRLPGGDTNYRELLITVPEAVTQRHAPQNNGRKVPSFGGPHYNDRNIVAHLRMNDRRDADGKRVLFIEEIQSDWAQEGRDEGFATRLTDIDYTRRRALDNERLGLEEQYKGVLDDILLDELNRTELSRSALTSTGLHDVSHYRELSTAMDLGDTAPEFIDPKKFEGLKNLKRRKAEVDREIERLKSPMRGVLRGPYVGKTEAWVALAMKKVVALAVAEGYDRVAWTTGDQQNERWSLEKQVRSIAWAEATGKGGDRIVTIDVKQGNDIEVRVGSDGIIGGIGNQRSGTQFDGQHINAVVGDVIGAKILGERDGELRGDGLAVGGDGMRAFYDKIVPQITNDVLKKVKGGKVGSVAIPERTAGTLWERARPESVVAHPNANAESRWFVVLSDGTEIGRWVTESDAKDEMVKHQALWDEGKPTMPQPGFEITPELKAAVGTEGFSLFQPAFHGSPHVFEQFKMQHIGSGEGAGAYGWGLYFTDAKAIAKYYRDTLTPRADFRDFRVGSKQVFRNGQLLDFSPGPSDYENVRSTLIEHLLLNEGDLQSAQGTGKLQDFILGELDAQIKDLETEWPEGAVAAKKLRRDLARPNAIAMKMDGPTGRIYQVDIPGDDTMLDYDRPLSEQSPKVRETLERAGIPVSEEFTAETFPATYGIPNGVIEKTERPDFAPKFELVTDGSRFTLSFEDVRRTIGEAQTGAGIYGALVQRFHKEGEKNPAEAASRYLSSLGINGIKYKAGQLSNIESGATNYVIFDEKLVNITGFEQRKGNAPRGRLQFGRDRQFEIDLFEKADLSTFLHESAHFYLEVFKDVTTGSNNEQIQADAGTLRGWLGIDSWDDLDVRAHEQFARGFEAYLMDGQSPSAGMRGIFARFRAWLLAVYRTVAALDVQITPEIRQVFDRLVATEDEIAAAQAEQQMTPLLTDPAVAEKLNLSPEFNAKYGAAVAEAKQAGEEELAGRLIRDVQREQQQWWNGERERVKAEVVTEVNTDPLYIALSVLQRGTMPDGSPLPEGMQPIKLSKAAIVNYYGDTKALADYLKTLPRPSVYAVEGGVTPDEAAALFGFKDGDALLNGISTAERYRDHVNRLTDERMKDQFGDVFTDGRLPIEAMKAVHNEKRAQVLRLELETLARDDLPTLKTLVRKVTRRVPTMDVVRAEAQRVVAGKRVRDINPLLYQRAEAKAAAAAVEALLKGDIDLAFQQKLRELENHELYRAATAAIDEIDSIVTYMRRFDKPLVRQKLGKAGEDYLDQIDALRERYDFSRTVSLKRIDRRRSLLAWVHEQTNQGNSPVVPEAVLNEARQISYKEVPLEELRGVRDAVRSIDYLATLKNKLLASEKARTVGEAADEIEAGIRENHDISPEPLDFAPGITDRLKKWAGEGVAFHTRMEFLFEFLDGKPNGPLFQHAFKPFADAENTENTILNGIVVNLNRLFGVYPKSERALWFWRKQRIDGVKTSMTKANLLTLALNQGNAYNRDAVLAGYGWKQSDVDRALTALTKQDWDTVQSVWDYLETFRDASFDLQQAVSGIRPEAVEATPVKTAHGEYRGGYYPIVFDSKLSWRQTALDEKAAVTEAFGGQWARAMTRHGHLKERTNTGGKPILLELTGLTNHLTNLAHDLAFRRAVIDVAKIIEHKKVKTAIEGAAGLAMYKQLHPWLLAIASDRRGDPMNPVEGLLANARGGATVVSLGLKFTSAMVQTLGYFNVAEVLGVKYASIGMREVLRNPMSLAQTWKFVAGKSAMMAQRTSNFDRDVRDAMQSLNVAGVKTGPLSVVDAYAGGMRKSFFSLIGFMDLATSTPTWLGAYRKAMDGAQKGIEAGDETAAIAFADSVVRKTQSAGAAKDLAAVQRGSQAFKLFTMFYSQLSLQFNLFARAIGNQKIERSVPQLIASLALLWFLPAIAEEVLRGRIPDDDADPEEWLKWFLRAEAFYPFNTVVLLRDVAGSLERYAETGTLDYSGSPAFDAVESIVKGLAAAGKAVTPDVDLTRADVKATVMAVGYTFHLPTRQVWQTAEYFYDWLTGKEDPASVLEGLWRAAVIGKPRK